MKKLFLLFLMMGSITVNAQNKLDHGQMSPSDFEKLREQARSFDFSRQTPENPYMAMLVGLAGMKGLIQEDRWYWVSPGRISYKLDETDVYEKYEDSEIYDKPEPRTSPMQFVKVGELYLPYIRLGYPTIHAQVLDPESIKNLPQYLDLLKKQDVVYIDSLTGQIISRDKAAFSCCYMYVHMFEEKPRVMEIVRVLAAATVYSYYPSGRLESKTVYRYQYEDNPQYKQVPRTMTVSKEVYDDSDKARMLESTGSTSIDIGNISIEVLVPLFMENEKIPQQFFPKR